MTSDDLNAWLDTLGPADRTQLLNSMLEEVLGPPKGWLVEGPGTESLFLDRMWAENHIVTNPRARTIRALYCLKD